METQSSEYTTLKNCFMTRQIRKNTATQNLYSEEFNAEALEQAKKVGLPKAANQLGMHEFQLYGKRNKA